MIKIYGKENCSKCETLKNILTDKNINFEYSDDIKTLMVIASKARIMSAPVIDYNGTIYSIEKFLEELSK